MKYTERVNIETVIIRQILKKFPEIYSNSEDLILYLRESPNFAYLKLH